MPVQPHFPSFFSRHIHPLQSSIKTVASCALHRIVNQPPSCQDYKVRTTPKAWGRQGVIKPPEVDPGDQMRYFSGSDACPQLFEPETDITTVALQ